MPDPVWIISSGERYHRSTCGIARVRSHRFIDVFRLNGKRPFELDTHHASSVVDDIRQQHDNLS